MIGMILRLISFIFRILLIMIGIVATYQLVMAGLYLATTPQLLKGDLLQITEGETQIISFPRQKPVANVEEFRIQYVTGDEIATDMMTAVIAIEDQRFRKHHGVDFYAIVRAFYYNLQAKEYNQGGSTITQQLAKNLYISPEKKFSRKIVEAYLALKLEKQFSKDEILEMYLNQMYYGQGQYGIERAAQYFFKVPAKDLTIAQSAYLAGLLQAPSFYTASENEVYVRERQKLVLEQMVQLGYSSRQQAEQSLEEFLSSEN